MNFAIIPWAPQFLHDKMFDISDITINFDHRQEPYLDMKMEFERKGHMLHTIDWYADLEQIDYFLFFEIDWKWVYRIYKAGKADRMVYCNAEPPSVNPLNCLEGYRKRECFFPYIMSWNEDWIDGENIFYRNIPYYFGKPTVSEFPFAKRKLLTSISGYKKSSHPDELYTEREKVIHFFEVNYPDQFDFYGSGWEIKGHPCYRGRAEVKAQVYHQYRFAICFENIGGLKGYVTEKILDCLTSGIVPIYLGAENIEQYIPKDCYIDYREYATYQSLALKLLSIDENEYQAYLDNAHKYLKSNRIEAFSGAKYADYIIEAVSKRKEFQIERKYMVDMWRYLLKQIKSEKVIVCKKKLKGLWNYGTR